MKDIMEAAKTEAVKVVDYNVLNNMKAEGIGNRLALLKKAKTDYEISIREYQNIRKNKALKVNEIANKIEQYKELPEKLKELEAERNEIIKSIPNESDLEFWKTEKDRVGDIYLAEKCIAEQRPDFAGIEKIEHSLKQTLAPTMEHKLNNAELENRFKNLSKKDIEKMKNLYPNHKEFNKIMDMKERNIIEKTASKTLKASP